MEVHHRLTVHYMIRAGILAGFSFYVVHLVKMDKLQYYLAPRMIPYIKYSTVALFLLAVYFVYLALQSSMHKHEEAECDCGHEPPSSFPKSIFLYSVFLLPLLLGFVLPDKIMGSEAAAVKGMKLTVTSVQQPSKPVLAKSNEGTTDLQKPAPEEPAESTEPADADSKAKQLDALFPYDEYSKDFSDLGKIFYGMDFISVKADGFLEFISTLDMYRNNFIGKTVEISGFVYREEDMAPNQFVVSRMVLSCCTADAEPYGIMAEWDKAADLNKDTWVTLSGKIELKEYSGNEIIVLKTGKITMIDPPKDPYVYPYFGDITELVK